MIKSFAHKGLKAFFETGSIAGIQAIHAKRLSLILASLNRAKQVQDLNAPVLRLHELKGQQKGTWSLTVQANWRVTFRFEDGDVELVNYLDYH
jgi:proteic killer suppression protein